MKRHVCFFLRHFVQLSHEYSVIIRYTHSVCPSSVSHFSFFNLQRSQALLRLTRVDRCRRDSSFPRLEPEGVVTGEGTMISGAGDKRSEKHL